MTPELAAFRDVDFDWARHLQSVWNDPPFNVEDLHKPLADDLMESFVKLGRPGSSSAMGRVIVGQAGSGKTHLIGNLRRRVWESEGWFVLLDIVGITDFWRTAALGFINSLLQTMPDGRPQYEAIMLAVLKRLPRHAVEAVAKEEGGIRKGNVVETADRFVALLRKAYPSGGLRHRDIVRAFLLLRSEETLDPAYSWLQGLDIEPGERKALGFHAAPPEPSELVRGMSWLMSLAGPTMIAVDQIDSIVTAANLSSGTSADDGDDVERKARSIIETLAGGLMDIRDVTSRSMSVVACLPSTWNVLKSRALKPALQRFQDPVALEAVKSSEILTKLIVERLASAYGRTEFSPPSPIWPFTAEAIESAKGLPPRIVLMRCEEHRRRCVDDGRVFECRSLAEGRANDGSGSFSGSLDAEFERRVEAAEIGQLRKLDNDSKGLRELISETLAVYVKQLETPEDVDVVVREDPNERTPTLHGRVVFTFHAENDREQHYCFRVLNHSNALAFQARLRAAMTASGVDRTLPFRHLLVIRGGEPPSGKVTAKLVADFLAAGGTFIAPSDDDLRSFVALREMLGGDPDGLEAWLRRRKPLCDTAFFRDAGLCPAPIPGTQPGGAALEQPESGAAGTGGPSGRDDDVPITTPPRDSGEGSAIVTGAERQGAAKGATAEFQPERPGRTAEISARLPPKTRPGDAAEKRPETPRQIPVGRRLEGGGEGRAEFLAADLLPRHTAILAGAGSGKTVLLRRIVEEAALLGIPAIVLDTNNDLARLGDPWPQRPASFRDEDAAKATAYREQVEVVIWTPGLDAGNPLALSILPDFSALDDVQERDRAVQMAFATLMPFVGASGARGPLKEGVLADALRHFAREGGGSLDRLVALLSELPEGVSQIDEPEKLAREMANRLRAAVSTNPLLKAGGQILDPAALMQGGRGRTRISVVNFSGLPADQARQAFVNQLQMSLFTWIRKHPSPTGRLYVIDEAQNFAPAGQSTPASTSTLALAAQARKYGLGMILATQAPKGVEHKIISNCTTHFYGRQNSPAAIQAAAELIAAKGGGSGNDIGRLATGQFYFSTEGFARPVKVKTPLCLSYHPANPLDPEEVELRARRSVPAALSAI